MALAQELKASPSATIGVCGLDAVKDEDLLLAKVLHANDGVSVDLILADHAHPILAEFRQ